MENSIFAIQKNDITVQDLKALQTLLEQLTSSVPDLDIQSLQKIMNSSIILTVRDTSRNNLLIGTGTLVFVQKMTLTHGIIQEVVVDKSYRGKGLGRKIMERLLYEGKCAEATFIELTSKPNRKEAHYLYQSMGFEKRDTNVYRLHLHNS